MPLSGPPARMPLSRPPAPMHLSGLAPEVLTGAARPGGSYRGRSPRRFLPGPFAPEVLTGVWREWECGKTGATFPTAYP